MLLANLEERKYTNLLCLEIHGIGQPGSAATAAAVAGSLITVPKTTQQHSYISCVMSFPDPQRIIMKLWNG